MIVAAPLLIPDDAAIEMMMLVLIVSPDASCTEKAPLLVHRTRTLSKFLVKRRDGWTSAFDVNARSVPRRSGHAFQADEAASMQAEIPVVVRNVSVLKPPGTAGSARQFIAARLNVDRGHVTIGFNSEAEVGERWRDLPAASDASMSDRQLSVRRRRARRESAVLSLHVRMGCDRATGKGAMFQI